MNYSGISISYPYVWLDIEASLPKVARLNWQQAIAVWEEGNNDPGEDAQQKVALTVFTIFNGRFLYVPRPSSSLPRWAESAREVLALNTIYHLNYFHFYITCIFFLRLQINLHLRANCLSLTSSSLARRPTVREGSCRRCRFTEPNLSLNPSVPPCKIGLARETNRLACTSGGK